MPDDEGLEYDSAVFHVTWLKLVANEEVVVIFPKDMFDDISIPMCTHLESVAIFVEDVHQVIRVIDEKFDAIELIAAMKLGQKPSPRLFRRRRKQPEIQYFVCFGIEGTVQPVVVTVDADHFLVNRELIRGYLRSGL